MNGVPQNALDVRRSNRSTVLRQIYFEAPVSRQQISQQSGLSPATVTNVVNELIGKGIVVESGNVDSAGGRPRVLLAINPDCGYLVGITIRAWYVYIELFDLMLRSLAKAEWTFDPKSDTPEDVVSQVGIELDALLLQARIQRDQVLGVGVGISANIDPQSGTVVYAPLIGWPTGLPLDTLLRDQLRLPVLLENGARAVIFAESLSRAQQPPASLGSLMIGRALGAAFMLRGEVLSGATNGAVQWAHTCVERHGRPCICGNAGCLDSYVGAPGIIQTYNELDPALPLSDEHEYEAVATLVDRARHGDDTAITALRETTHYLGIGVANFINLFDPELVVIGGRTGAIIGPYILPELSEIVARYVYRKPFDQGRVTISSLGVGALTKGPAALVLDRFLRMADVMAPTVTPVVVKQTA